MAASKYVLDANVFIEAYQRYYAFDIAPKFWASIVTAASNKELLSIDRIKDELAKGKDQLAAWAAKDCAHAFESSSDANVIAAFANCMNWVQASNQFLPQAKSEFAASADGWVIAYAKAHNCTVVTHETFDPNIRKRVKIPNVCKQFAVPYVNTYAMMRELKIMWN